MDKLELIAVAPGRIVSMDEVPDPVFSGRMMGDGYALVPDGSDAFDVVAPCSGTLTRVFHTGHAFVLNHNGVDVIVHIGIDTVDLHGAGFSILRQVGEDVFAGDPVIHVDARAIRYAGKNLITPVVVMKDLAGMKIMHGETTCVVSFSAES